MTQLRQAAPSTIPTRRQLPHHSLLERAKKQSQRTATSGGTLLCMKNDNGFLASCDVLHIQEKTRDESWLHSTPAAADNFSVISSSDSGVEEECKDEPFSNTASQQNVMIQDTTFQLHQERDPGIGSSRPLVQHDYRDHAFQPYAFPSTNFSVSQTLSAAQSLWSHDCEKNYKAHSLQSLPSPRCENSATSRTTTSSTCSARRLSGSLCTEHSQVGIKCLTSPLEGSAIDDTTGPFPQKLHHMLKSTSDDKHLRFIISWQPHGRSFIVRMPDKLVAILGRYFRHCKLASFQRQLNLYGFKRITQGPDRGAYYHEFFLRGRPSLCRYITRIGIKGIKVKPLPNPSKEPNFYAMKPCFEDNGFDVESDEKPGMKLNPSFPPSPLRPLSLKNIGEAECGSKAFELRKTDHFSDFDGPTNLPRLLRLHDQQSLSFSQLGPPQSSPGDGNVKMHNNCSKLVATDIDAQKWQNGDSLATDCHVTSRVRNMLAPYTATEPLSWHNAEPMSVDTFHVSPFNFETNDLFSDKFMNNNIADMTLDAHVKSGNKSKSHPFGSDLDNRYGHQTALSSLCLATVLHSHTTLSLPSPETTRMSFPEDEQKNMECDPCEESAISRICNKGPIENDDDPLCDTDIDSVDPRMLRAMEARFGHES